MKKRLLTVLVVIIVSVVVIVTAVFLNLGKTIKFAVETFVPKVTGVNAKVDKVIVRPCKGYVEVSGFVLGNPEGFKSDYAVSLGNFKVKLKTLSLFTDKIHIQDVVIKDPKIIYELGMGQSNIGTILNKLDKASKEDNSNADDKSKGKGNKTQKKVVVDHFKFEGGEIAIASKLTQGKTLVLPLPPLELNDLGKDDPNGINPLRLFGKILDSLLTSAIKAVGDVAGINVKTLQDAGGSLSELGDTTAKAISDVGQRLTDSINGVLGKKKGKEKKLEIPVTDAVNKMLDDLSGTLNGNKK